MITFGLNCSDWDFKSLKAEQAVELFAYMLSFVIETNDEARRLAIFNSFKSLITEQIEKPNDIDVRVEFLKLTATSTSKKHLTALEGISKTTSYMCRMITHHDEELVRRASLGKAQYLVKKWADRRSRRGFSNETLRKNWGTYKTYAPLITAYSRILNRLRQNTHNDKDHDDVLSKLRARLVDIVITAPTILRQALHIQNLLSQHRAWGGETVLDPVNELYFNIKTLPVSAKPVKWKRLTDSDLELLKTNYMKDLEMKRSG